MPYNEPNTSGEMRICALLPSEKMTPGSGSTGFSPKQYP